MTKSNEQIEKILVNYQCIINIVSIILGIFLALFLSIEIITIEGLILGLIIYCAILTIIAIKLMRMRFK